MGLRIDYRRACGVCACPGLPRLADFLRAVFHETVNEATHQQRETDLAPARRFSSVPRHSVRQGEVAHELGISPRTVEFHKSKLMSILGIQSMVGLVRFASESGIAAGRDLLDNSDAT